jgi:uncharacterized protein YkwD
MRTLVYRALALGLAAVALASARPARAQGPESLITLHNQARAAYGLPPLQWNQQLWQAAGRHARDMAANNLTGHDGSDGSTSESRIRDAGFGGTYIAENVGYAWATDPAYLWKHPQMMDWWMNSPPHRANILNPSFTQIGMARIVVQVGGEERAYWCVTFGGP